MNTSSRMQKGLRLCTKILNTGNKKVTLSERDKTLLRPYGINYDDLSIRNYYIVTPKARKGSYKAVPAALKLLLNDLSLSIKSNKDLSTLLKKNSNVPIPSNLWNKKLATYDKKALKDILARESLKYDESLLRGKTTLSQIKKELKRDFSIEQSNYSFSVSINLTGDTVMINGKSHPIVKRRENSCVRLSTKEGARVWIRLDALLALEG